MTLLMFPMGSVILVHTMPKGSGLVWDRGLKNHLEEAGGELWLKEYRRKTHTQQPLRKLVRFKLVHIYSDYK